jgi:hypothetical protein
MKADRTYVSVCKISGKLYIASQAVAYVEEFDIKTSSFRQLYTAFAGPSMLLCSVGDRLILLSNGKTFEMYISDT